MNMYNAGCVTWLTGQYFQRVAVNTQGRANAGFLKQRGEIPKGDPNGQLSCRCIGALS